MNNVLNEEECNSEKYLTLKRLNSAVFAICFSLKSQYQFVCLTKKKLK